MSWDRLLETGSGGIALRIEIEGLARQFCTEPAMERTLSDGRIVIACMAPMGQGFVIDEKVTIPEATFDVQGNRIELEETVAEDLAGIFNANPTVTTQLAMSISKDASSLQVASITGLAAGSVIHIGTEAMLVTSASGVTLGVTRGYRGTIAQAHYSHDPSSGGGYINVTDMPSRVRGRRVRVYAYGDGDDLQGDGNQVWLGRTNTDPALGSNGLVWSLQVESIAAQLRSKIGSELANAMNPRGAYYHWAAPINVSILESVGATPHRFDGQKFFGFYETQSDFVSAFQEWLTPLLSAAGITSTFVTMVLADGTWSLQFTPATGVTDVGIFIKSAQDGEAGGDSGAYTNADGEVVDRSALVVGETYDLNWAISPPGARTIPRGIFGLWSLNQPTPIDQYSDASQRSELHEQRIYLSRPVASDWTAAKLAWGDAGAGSTIVIDSVDVDTNSILMRGLAYLNTPGRIYNSQQVAQITPGRTLAQGGIANLRDAFLSEGPVFANRGTMPFFGDASSPDLGDWSSAASLAESGQPFLVGRNYTVFAEADLDRYLAQEALLRGCYFALDDDGRIALRRFKTPNATTDLAAEIDDELLEGDWALLEPDAQGSVNTVTIKTGYDPTTDKWLGTTYNVISATAYEGDHDSRTLEIAPKSTESIISPMDQAAAERLALPYVGYFGQPYKQVTIAVSWMLFPVRCGDVVSVSSQHLPSFTGRRPMTAAVGIVVGRHWAFGEAHGTLTILVSPQNVAGYAPSAEVQSQSNVGGNTWDLIIRTGRYAPAGTTEVEFFAATDVVEIVQRATTTPTVIQGTVVSVNAGTNTIRVTFNSAWVPGASLWELEFAAYASVTAGQKVYCFIAGRDARIDGTDPARTFAP